MPPFTDIPTLHVACDGSALRNPTGPGGWCWYASNRHWAAGGAAQATNNQMELQALLEFLRATNGLPPRQLVTIYLDSRYTIDSVTKWVKGWRRNGWRTKDGNPVKNATMIAEAADILDARPGTTLTWVRGHSGHPLNEAADTLARQAANAADAGQVRLSGPGWATHPNLLWPPPPHPDDTTIDLYRTIGNAAAGAWGWVGPGGRRNAGRGRFTSDGQAVLYATLNLLRLAPTGRGIKLLVPPATVPLFATPPGAANPHERGLLKEVAAAATAAAATWQVVADMAPLPLD